MPCAWDGCRGHETRYTIPRPRLSEFLTSNGGTCMSQVSTLRRMQTDPHCQAALRCVIVLTWGGDAKDNFPIKGNVRVLDLNIATTDKSCQAKGRDKRKQHMMLGQAKSFPLLGKDGRRVQGCRTIKKRPKGLFSGGLQNNQSLLSVSRKSAIRCWFSGVRSDSIGNDVSIEICTLVSDFGKNFIFNF